MKLTNGQAVADVGGGKLQIVPNTAQQIAKLERYLERDPKGPKAKDYRAKLEALRKQASTGGGLIHDA